MQITSVEIRDFRSLTEAVVPLSPTTTMVLGANGAGKSSLAGAITYALTGACPWTDRKGAGATCLIAHGQSEASVDLATDAGDLRRLVTDSGTRLSFDNRSGEAAAAALTAALPSRELLDVMLDSSHFVNLPVKDQQSILFSLSGGAADAAWFRKQLSSEEAEAMRGDLATGLTGGPLADALYKAAYARRTEANRTAKAAKAKLEAMNDVPKPAKTDTAAKLAEAHKALGQAQRRASAEEQAEALRKQLADLGERPAAPTPEQLAEAEATVEKLVAERQAAKDVLARMEGEAHALSAQAKQFSTLDSGRCVLGTIECPVSAENRQKAFEQAEGTLAKLVEQMAAAEETEHGIGEKHLAAAVTVSQLRDAQVASQRWQTKADELQKAIDAIQIPEGCDVEEAQAAVDELTAKQASEAAAREKAASRKVVAEQHSEAFARAKLLDGLVKKLEPTGLPAKAMAETVGRVEEQINEVLGAFSEFAISVAGAELVVKRNGVATPVRLLSESEKLRVGAAIQVAVAKLTGFGFVIVDAADRLDTGHRGKLVGMLLDSGVQSLVLATPLNGKRPRANGLAVYDIVDGTVVPSDEVAAKAA